MLQELCARHPDMLITREFGNFMGLGSSYPTYARYILRRLTRINIKWSVPARPVPSPVRLVVNVSLVVRYLALLHQLKADRIAVPEIEATLRRLFPGNAVVGDKYPGYIFELDDLVKAPGLRCVVIYRDCRDVTSSTLRLARTVWRRRPWVNNLNTAEKVALRWLQCIENMEAHADRIHIIRYENLVTQPRLTIEALGNWLGVDPGGFPIEIIKHVNIGKYRRGLTSQELNDIEKTAGPVMAKLGYD